MALTIEFVRAFRPRGTHSTVAWFFFCLSEAIHRPPLWIRLVSKQVLDWFWSRTQLSFPCSFLPFLTMVFLLFDAQALQVVYSFLETGENFLENIITNLYSFHLSLSEQNRRRPPIAGRQIQKKRVRLGNPRSGGKAGIRIGRRAKASKMANRGWIENERSGHDAETSAWSSQNQVVAFNTLFRGKRPH